VDAGRSTADDLADEYFEHSLLLDPIAATYAGVRGYDHLVTDYSPAGHEARADHARQTLARLDGLTDRSDLTDRRATVTGAALRERLQQQVGEHEAGADLASLNNIACPVQGLREVFDVAPRATPQDWDAITERLSLLPGSLAGYRASLSQAVAGGWRPAGRQIRAAVGQAREFGAADGFFADLVAEHPAAANAAATDAAAGASAAYLELAAWLDSDLGPRARQDDAVGRDLYAVLSAGFLGTRVDLDETYAWGLDELARIEDRMAGLAARLAPDVVGDVATRISAGIEALDADPRRSLDGAEAFRDWMQDLSDRAVEALAGRHFDIPGPIRDLRCRLAPSSSGGVYYTAPSEDLTRPGQMWWAVPHGVSTFSTWRETSTVYHEGVPGHHLQCAQALYNTEGLGRWRRLGIWVSGHGEGWALYAERLMEELGHLEDVGDLMGMLDAHALRAARVVVDIGVHCALPAPQELGGGVWDAAKAWDYLRRHTRVADPTLRFELDRYLGWPGQAISYKVGERRWLDLRERARAREGAAFDLRAFHSRALALGSVGLDVLSDALR
jgi:uncharacterized protein (DUF885 family)